MATQQTTAVVLEPAAQEFADATATPPLISAESPSRTRPEPRRGAAAGGGP